MKTTIISITLSMLTLTCFAQFPIPANFEFSYDYIMIDQSGYCDGQFINGPSYCSNFSWLVPDTSSTTANLEYYKIYYHDYSSQQTTILASIPDTTFEMEIGIPGEIWVTAYYSNPEGESEPSNTIINEELPISILDNLRMNAIGIVYNRNQDIITIKNMENLAIVNVYESTGRLMKSEKPCINEIQMSEFKRGLYIIEIISTKNDLKKYKIVK